ILVNIESYKKCSSAISLQGREKSVRKSSIRAILEATRLFIFRRIALNQLNFGNRPLKLI
ncbi:hypothetical protein, partial [Weissella confusa]|uniref:hypothetical protein n=1 Tax=Weissella confusa TaxID=1583 RepID=UPI00223B85C2